MVIAITGHRPNKFGNDYDLTSPLILNIRKELVNIWYDLKPEYMISGMALGIDTLWAQIAIEAGEPYKLIAAVPFKGQEKMWPKKSQDEYFRLLNKAHEIVYVSEPGYAAWKMQKRNEWMVDNCDKLIAVWDESEGGTANCVKYAKKKEKEIIHINPKDYGAR